MIKETDGDHFEEMRSLEQNLTFEAAKKEFSNRNVLFGEAQMKTLGIMTHDGVYTNLGLLLSDQCVHTIRVAAFEGTTLSGRSSNQSGKQELLNEHSNSWIRKTFIISFLRLCQTHQHALY